VQSDEIERSVRGFEAIAVRIAFDGSFGNCSAFLVCSHLFAVPLISSQTKYGILIEIVVYLIFRLRMFIS
jgi:hypothetical protein